MLTQKGQMARLYSICHTRSFYEEEVTNMLLNNNANIEELDNYGQTPLFEIIENGSLENMKLLIERGARIEARNKLGETPLLFLLRSLNHCRYHCSYSDESKAQFLLMRGDKYFCD